MGRLKELMIKMEEDRLGVHLAELWGISYWDFYKLDYEIKDESPNGVFSYNYIEFSTDSPQDILSKIPGIEGRKVILGPDDLNFDNDEYYQQQFEAITSNKNFYSSFLSEMENVEKLADLDVQNAQLQNILYRQIFISIFGILETFLSDTFINLTIENETYLRNFVRSHQEFKQRKFELRDVFEYYAKIKDTAQKVMLDTIYHDLHKVKEMYISTFDIEFPEIKEMMSQVAVRHDLVHRNGKTKDGIVVKIDRTAIDVLTSNTRAFVKHIADKLEIPPFDLPF